MSRHKLRATIPHGPSDEGAEIEVEIAFNYTRGRPAVMHLRNGDPGYPAGPDEVEFLDAAPLCNGKPSPFHGAFADLERQWLNDLAEAWLNSNEGQNEAFLTVADDDERAREYAAELRREP
jgi:hypothetical protein